MGKYFPPTSQEIHSLGIGFLDGLNPVRTKYSSLKKARGQLEDVDQEPHYYVTGYSLSNRGKWLLKGVFTAKALGI